MNRATCCGGIKKTTVWGGIRNPAIFSVFKPRAPRLRRTKIKPRYRWEEPRFLKIHYVRTEFYFHVLGCGVFSENSSGEVWQLRGVVPGSQLWGNLVSAVERCGNGKLSDRGQGICSSCMLWGNKSHLWKNSKPFQSDFKKVVCGGWFLYWHVNTSKDFWLSRLSRLSRCRECHGGVKSTSWHFVTPRDTSWHFKTLRDNYL